MENRAQTVSMSGVGFDRKAYGLSYRWVMTDGGRSTSKRPRQKNDCTCRALAIALNISYDAAYDMLHEAGRKCSRGFKFSDWVAKQPFATKISFPAVKGQRRMNPASFTAQFPTGVYICKVAKHVFAVIDGVVHDVFENSPDRCIYTAWAVVRPH